jgi:uncharacterized membrane protein
MPAVWHISDDEERRVTAKDHPPDSADRRKTRFNDIVTGVFGLVLGLGAFSITTADLNSTSEVWQALGTYVPAFFFVLAIWQTTSELFDRYPAADSVFYALITAVLFFATLPPVFLNLLLDEQRAVQQLSATLFPLTMAAVFAVLAVLWWRLGTLSRRQGSAPPSDIAGNVRIEVMLVGIFLASLAVPYDPDAFLSREVVWLAAFIVPNIVLWLTGRLHPERRSTD